MEQVWTISVPDLIARYGKIAFQFSSNSILFSSHIGSFAKNFFFYNIRYLKIAGKAW